MKRLEKRKGAAPRCDEKRDAKGVGALKPGNFGGEERHGVNGRI